MDLHECSSTSLLGKCWICSSRRDQPHAGLLAEHQPGTFESEEINKDCELGRCRLLVCARADSSFGKNMGRQRERKQTMITSTDPVVSF